MNKYPLVWPQILTRQSRGFTFNGEEIKITDNNGCFIFLGRLDSNQPDCQWGRFRFFANLPDNAIINVYAVAADNELTIETLDYIFKLDDILSNPDTACDECVNAMVAVNAQSYHSYTDMLLYKHSGRFLWLCIEIIGGGGATLKGFEVTAPRDNFLGALPNLYSTDSEFLHRYLAIFSSMYYDLKEEIDGIGSLLDPDTCPDQMLPYIAGWLGFEFEAGFLDPDVLRKLVKIGYPLMRKKGTRPAVNDILNILVGEGEFFIVEQGNFAVDTALLDKAVAQKLYGQSSFDLTILLKKRPKERFYAMLKYVLDQFVPIRCRVKLVFLEGLNTLDQYSYMDINANVVAEASGKSDEGQVLDGYWTME